MKSIVNFNDKLNRNNETQHLMVQIVEEDI